MTTTTTQVFSKAETSSPPTRGGVVEAFDLFHGNNVKIAFQSQRKDF